VSLVRVLVVANLFNEKQNNDVLLVGYQSTRVVSASEQVWFNKYIDY
jgi:hypothetical protein